MVLGSGIRNGVFPDPGYRGQKGTGSRIRNTGYDGVLQVPKLKLQYKVIGFKNCFNYESLLEICLVKIANFTEVLNYLSLIVEAIFEPLSIAELAISCRRRVRNNRQDMRAQSKRERKSIYKDNMKLLNTNRRPRRYLLHQASEDDHEYRE